MQPRRRKEADRRASAGEEKGRSRRRSRDRIARLLRQRRLDGAAEVRQRRRKDFRQDHRGECRPSFRHRARRRDPIRAQYPDCDLRRRRHHHRPFRANRKRAVWPACWRIRCRRRSASKKNAASRRLSAWTRSGPAFSPVCSASRITLVLRDDLLQIRGPDREPRADREHHPADGRARRCSTSSSRCPASRASS